MPATAMLGLSALCTERMQGYLPWGAHDVEAASSFRALQGAVSVGTAFYLTELQRMKKLNTSLGLSLTL